MNTLTITGIVYKEPTEFINSDTGIRTVVFTLCNEFIDFTTSTPVKVNVKCICWGKVASYVWDELYEGCKVIVSGRISNRPRCVGDIWIKEACVNCSHVARLCQEDYD